MQKWEHRWEYLYLSNNEFTLNNKDLPYPLANDRAFDWLAKLGKMGWELVNVVPQIGDMRTAVETKTAGEGVGEALGRLFAGPGVSHLTQHLTGTIAYFFWFKRPLENEPFWEKEPDSFWEKNQESPQTKSSED